jgi:hypothetical protein
VMDPLAALRQCLKYLCSHPEIYGNDVRGLLDREVMHVVRLKASEVSLIQGQRPLLVDPLDSTSLRQATSSSAGRGVLPSISSTAAGAAGTWMTRASRQASMPPHHAAVAYDDCVAVGDLFGYGNVSFLPANSAGFSALLRDTRAQTLTSGVKTLTGRGDPSISAPPPPLTASQPLDEPIQWNGTLPPSASHVAAAAAAGGGGLSSVTGAATDERSSVCEPDGAAGHSGKDRRTEALAASPDYSVADPYDDVHRVDDARLFRQEDEMGRSFDFASTRGDGGEVAAVDGGGVVLDHHGYEVTYLRTQLQQLEAAFNAKCVRLHELESENKLFTEQMKASEAAAARWSAEHHAMEGKLEVLRRELDGWKDRANDALAAATKQSKQRSQHAKQLASNQINDAKQEAARVSQLWRETERALQESRRAFENTEKEASAAHNHLADAFHYLERLERRVARRDAYVRLCERRHRSLEEKYEKLMWGYEELSAVGGRYSYADYLLTTRPLWSVCLFLALAEHRGDYVAVEDQGEVKHRIATIASLFSKSGDAPDKDPTTATSEAAAEAATASQSWMLFARTPHGGFYAGACFDPLLIGRFIASEVTAEVTRHGRTKLLRTNLHGSVACRVIRWYELFGIDYLGGQDSFPDSGELNRKFVPVLTLASMILPLCNRRGSVALTDTSVPAGAVAAASAAKPNTPSVSHAVIANTHQYDEATIRFVLRCFWKERLHAFVRQMETRVQAIEARRQRLEQLRAQRHVSLPSVSNDLSAGLHTAEGSTVSDSENVADDAVDEDDDGAEEVTEGPSIIATFLAALVDFVTRFTKLSSTNFSGGGASAAVPPGLVDLEAVAATVSASSSSPSAPGTATLLRVRGVLARGSTAETGIGNSVTKPVRGATAASSTAPEASVWDCGRVFFATVLAQNTTKAASIAAAAAAATSATSGAAEVSKSMLSYSSNETEVAALAEDVRELLAALYYYTMEYKSRDADFRLFYLVSHQLIPEMVAINFFASLEGMQRDCAALLEKRLRFLAGETNDCGDGDAALDPDVAEAMAEVDDPLTSLTKAVRIIDEAPLEGQDDEIEPDSDGEGYGSIFPFRATATVHEHGQATSSATLPALLNSSDGESGRRDSSNAPTGTQRRARELRLLHNIRTYLKKRESRAAHGGGGGGNTDLFTSDDLLGNVEAVDETGMASNGADVSSPTAKNLSTSAFGDAPPEWTALEEAVMQHLAPHTALLDTFRAHYGPRMTAASSFTPSASRSTNATAATVVAKEERGYLRQKLEDRTSRHALARCLSATRGLLPLDDILALLQRHCFSTYAVACCGTPRFSLVDALMKGSEVNAGRGKVSLPTTWTTSMATRTSLQPYSLVGYLPPTGLHLQRLRFALSLDQPSHLVDPAKLFTVDAVTKANSHLYDAYLTLTLDLFQQQQSFLMQSVRASCAERHEKYAAEGAEDCDGQVPIAALRKGMKTALAAVHGSAQHATALVNHFLQYDALLRLEDEVKLEQFADAPLLLNIPAAPTHLQSSNGRGSSFYRSHHSVNMNSGNCGGVADPATASHHRRNDTNSMMEEVDDAEFNLREEAESCSLLHIAFAVRMTYIVWGRLCVDTATAMVRRVVQRPVPVCRSSEEDSHPYKASANAMPAIKVGELPEWDVFERQVHQRYAHTLERLRDGHNGDDNPLRRTLRGDLAKMLGLPSTVPYGVAGESAARRLASVGDAAAAAGTTATGPSAAAHGGDAATVDATPLYPDMEHVFGAAEPTSSAAASIAAGGEAAVAVPGEAKSKKNDGAALHGSHVSSSASKRSSAAPQSLEEHWKAVPLLPDCELISLSRALGFPSPVIVPAASSGGLGGAASSASKKSAGKKAPKKPVSKKMTGSGSAGGLSFAAQEEYSRALSTQLQNFAARISRLAQHHNNQLPEKTGENQEREAFAAKSPAEEAVPTANAAAAAGSADLVPSTKSASAEAEKPGAPPSAVARATPRMRSVAFVYDSHGGHDVDEAGRSRLNSGSETKGQPGSNRGCAHMWRPAFAEEAREVEANGDRSGSSPGAVLDVSKLYAACAALSIL